MKKGQIDSVLPLFVFGHLEVPDDIDVLMVVCRLPVKAAVHDKEVLDTTNVAGDCPTNHIWWIISDVMR